MAKQPRRRRAPSQGPANPFQPRAEEPTPSVVPDSPPDWPPAAADAPPSSPAAADAAPDSPVGGHPALTPDEIRLQAYYRYLQRRDGEGDEISDWLAAEAELRSTDRPGA